MFIISCALILFLGINGYLTVKGVSVQDDLSFKYIAENFLFISFILIIVLVIVFLFILFKSRNVIKELDKIVELSQQGDYSPSRHLEKLGTLGEKISDLNAQISTLNDMKSVKISSISNLNDFLLNKIDAKLLITDISGQIVKVSKSFLDSFDIEKKNIIDKNIEELIENLDIRSLNSELKSRKSFILKGGIRLKNLENGKYFIFYPISNMKNQLSNIVCVVEDEKTIKKLLEEEKKSNLEGEDIIQPFIDKSSDLFKHKD
jgi:transcriptional regulator with PAS, ATPase and Fis domain